MVTFSSKKDQRMILTLQSSKKYIAPGNLTCQRIFCLENVTTVISRYEIKRIAALLKQNQGICYTVTAMQTAIYHF